MPQAAEQKYDGNARVLQPKTATHSQPGFAYLPRIRAPFFLVAAMMIAVAGCQQTSDAQTDTPKVPASTKVDQLAETLNRAQVHVDNATKAVVSLTPENLAAQKPVAVAAIGEIKTDLNEAQGKAADAGKTAKRQEQDAAAENKRDDARIAELEAADPVRTWFRWIGGILVVAAVAAGVMAAFIRNSTLAAASVAAAAGGFALLAIAAFLKAILVSALCVIACLFAVASAWALWRWRQNLKALVSTQTAVALLNPTEQQKEVLRKVQTADAEAVFRKVVKPKEVAK